MIHCYTSKVIKLHNRIVPFCNHQKRNYLRSTIKMMPEGPEVRCLVDKLNDKLDNNDNYKLMSSSIISGRYIRELPIGYSELMSNLPLKLVDIKSKGKFIYFTLQNSNDNITMWQTLGLTGGFSSNPNAKHIRYTLTFMNERDNVKKTLYYYDQRNFGTLKISFNDTELIKKLDSIGPCWINDNISFNDFLNIVDKTTKKSKTDLYLVNFLMNQKKTAGHHYYSHHYYRVDYDYHYHYHQV